MPGGTSLFTSPIRSASSLATYILAAFEGAIVLSRAAHDTRPLRVTADIVTATVRAEFSGQALPGND